MRDTMDNQDIGRNGPKSLQIHRFPGATLLAVLGNQSLSLITANTLNQQTPVPHGHNLFCTHSSILYLPHFCISDSPPSRMLNSSKQNML